MKPLHFVTLCALLCVSCATARFQPVSDTYTGEVRIDSVFVFDSVYIDRIRIIKEKADTVYVTDWKTEYKIKGRDRNGMTATLTIRHSDATLCPLNGFSSVGGRTTQNQTRLLQCRTDVSVTNGLSRYSTKGF